MAIVVAGVFVPFITGGYGFIAIVIAMLARGRPVWVLIGALLFGIALSIATALQLVGDRRLHRPRPDAAVPRRHSRPGAVRASHDVAGGAGDAVRSGSNERQ